MTPDTKRLLLGTKVETPEMHTNVHEIQDDMSQGNWEAIKDEVVRDVNVEPGYPLLCNAKLYMSKQWRL